MQTAVSILKRIWRVIRWPILIAVVGYVGLVVYYMIQIPKMDAAAIEKINTAKLTMKDVDGSNLPPQPDPKLVDATVEGVDANKNGIRDDVELAIFKKYPNDIKIRAAALQYAKAGQYFLSIVVNRSTWAAADGDVSRAIKCFKTNDIDPSKITTAINFVDSSMLSTLERKVALEETAKYTTTSGTAPGPICDVNVQ